MKLLCMAILAVVLIVFSCPALAAGAAQIQMKDLKFQPSEVTIQSGGTVTWTNADSVIHDVKFKDSGSPDLKKGEQYSKRFDKPGTYDYVCDIHPGMKGKVIVK